MMKLLVKTWRLHPSESSESKSPGVESPDKDPGTLRFRDVNAPGEDAMPDTVAGLESASKQIIFAVAKGMLSGLWLMDLWWIPTKMDLFQPYSINDNMLPGHSTCKPNVCRYSSSKWNTTHQRKNKKT